MACLSLPGCGSQDATEDEALQNIRIAIREYLEVLQVKGRSVDFINSGALHIREDLPEIRLGIGAKNHLKLRRQVDAHGHFAPAKHMKGGIPNDTAPERNPH